MEFNRLFTHSIEQILYSMRKMANVIPYLQIKQRDQLHLAQIASTLGYENISNLDQFCYRPEISHIISYFICQGCKYNIA